MRSGAIRRFGSYFVDNIVMNIISIPMLFIFAGRIFDIINLGIKMDNGIITESEFLSHYFDFMFQLLLVLGLYLTVVTIIYYAIIPLYWQGKTVGRSVSGCYVKAIDDRELTFSRLFVREFIFKFLWWFVTFGLGSIIDFIMVASREDKLTIRDIITKTEVVEIDGESVKKEYNNF